MVLEVISLALTRKTCSGRGVGCSCIIPPTSSCLSIHLFMYHLHPAPAFQSCMRSLLLGGLFIAAMPLPGHLFSQQHFYGEFSIVGRSLLAHQAIPWSNPFMRLGQFL